MINEITVYQINKIANFKGEIWAEEDNDYPDYRKVKLYERACDRYLKPYDQKQQSEIYNLIHWHDNTYGDMERLQDAGYTIIRDSKEQAEFILKYNLRKNIPFKY